MIIFLHRANTFVSTFGIDTLGTRVTRVPPLDRLIVALVDVEALGALSAIVEGASISGLTATVVPTGHVETGRRLVASMKITSAFVQVEFATVANVATPTRASSWRHALTTILTGLIADS